MGHLLFFLFVVAACLLWSAAFTAAAARTERTWLRGMLAAVAVIVPPLALVPWVAITAGLAALKLETNWFAPTLTAFLAAVIGGLWIAAAGLTRKPVDGMRVAAAWPVVGLAALCVMAKAVAFGTLLCIDNAVVAEGRALRVEAAQIMAPSVDDDAAPLYVRAFAALEDDKALAAAESPLFERLADPASPAVAEVLVRHAATLDLLRRAADRPGCRFVRDWSRPSLDLLLPEIQSMRQAARLLALDARRAAAAGDAAAAVRDVVRMHRIAVHAASEPILISGLVGLALDAVALDTLAEILPRLERSDQSLLDDPTLRDVVDSPLAFQGQYLGEEAFGLATLADLADCRTGGAAQGTGPSRGGRRARGRDPLAAGDRLLSRVGGRTHTRTTRVGAPRPVHRRRAAALEIGGRHSRRLRSRPRRRGRRRSGARGCRNPRGQ